MSLDEETRRLYDQHGRLFLMTQATRMQEAKEEGMVEGKEFVAKTALPLVIEDELLI
jgi:hypothetical protein